MNNKDDRPDTDNDSFADRSPTRSGLQRRDPSFSDFVDTHDDSYEEPDRDTDFDASYATDSVEEEDFDEEFTDEDEELFEDEDADTRYDSDLSDADETDIWLEKEPAFEEDEDERQTWPIGLIAVAIVALVLLAAGGYGVMQQRAATEAELRELRSALATSASPQEVRTSRGALEELQLTHDKLLAEAESLRMENLRLADTVAGLEEQLGAQQNAMTKSAAIPAGAAKPTASASSESPSKPAITETVAAKPPTPQPTAVIPVATAPAPSSAAPARAANSPGMHTVTKTSGPWFVNFGSYAMRNMAETWAARLHPIAGQVIIAPNTSNGKTLYRVRVIGLADRDSAKAVARKLEAEQRVSELWVGKE